MKMAVIVSALFILWPIISLGIIAYLLVEDLKLRSRNAALRERAVQAEACYEALQVHANDLRAELGVRIGANAVSAQKGLAN